MRLRATQVIDGILIKSSIIEHILAQQRRATVSRCSSFFCACAGGAHALLPNETQPFGLFVFFVVLSMGRGGCAVGLRLWRVGAIKKTCRTESDRFFYVGVEVSYKKNTMAAKWLAAARSMKRCHTRW